MVIREGHHVFGLQFVPDSQSRRLTYQALSCRPAAAGRAKRLRFGARRYPRSIGASGSRSAAAPCWAAARQGRRGHWAGSGRAATGDAQVATAGAVCTVSPALGSGQSSRESNAYLARRAQTWRPAHAFESEEAAAETPAGSISLGSRRAHQATRNRGSEVLPNVLALSCRQGPLPKLARSAHGSVPRVSEADWK